MRRMLLASLFCSLALVGSAPAAGAAEDDVKGPRCADIIAGGVAYRDSTVLVTITLGGPSCSFVSYTTYVVESMTDPTVVAVQGQNGDGSTTLTFAIPVEDDDDEVCVYTETSVGKHLFDRAQDTSCVRLFENQDPPGLEYT